MDDDETKREVERLRRFRCPLCKSVQALIVFLPRPGGRSYKTPFYQCAGCTVLFHDVERFSRLTSKQVGGRGWLEDHHTLPPPVADYPQRRT